MKNEVKVLKEKFLDLYILQENLKNLLSIPLPHIGLRKVDIFFMEIQKEKFHALICNYNKNQERYEQYWGKVFP